VPRKTTAPETAPADTEPKIGQAALSPRSTTKKPARRKSDAAPKTRATRSPGARTTAASHPSDDQIRTRAYFIAERRHRFGLPGDAESDWLEAKRQLLSELGPR